MVRVLVIDEEAATTELIERLCAALDIPVEITATRANAIRCFSENPIEVIFLSADVELVDSKAMADEFDNLAADQHKPRPPLAIFYEKEEVVHRYGLNKLPRSTTLQKPVAFKDIYAILSVLKVINDDNIGVREEMEREVAALGRFITDSQAWVNKLKELVVES
jgi:DNA-binding response OmpR family regulator